MVEYSGDSLVGALDGSNCIFCVTADMAPGSTSVWRNGLLLSPGLEGGWARLDARRIQLREAPWPGDTVAVGYSTGAPLQLLPVQAELAEITPLTPVLRSAPLGAPTLAQAVQPLAGPTLSIQPMGNGAP